MSRLDSMNSGLPLKMRFSTPNGQIKPEYWLNIDYSLLYYNGIAWSDPSFQFCLPV